MFSKGHSIRGLTTALYLQPDDAPLLAAASRPTTPPRPASWTRKTASTTLPRTRARATALPTVFKALLQQCSKENPLGQPLAQTVLPTAPPRMARQPITAPSPRGSVRKSALLRLKVYSLVNVMGRHRWIEL